MADTASSERKRAFARPLLYSLLLVLLIALLFPTCRRCAHYASDVRQHAFFFSLESGLEAFRNELGAYPPSGALDDVNQPYCGAMKLTEAMMGQDLLGFRPASTFRLDGTDPNTGEPLYGSETLVYRMTPLLPDSAFVHRLVDVYGQGRTGPFAEHVYVLCDVYERKRPGGKKTGMPILYYRADVNGTAHDVNDPDNAANIYDYRDNQALIDLGVPGDPDAVHPLADPRRFYLNTWSHKSPEVPVPYCADRYILISAGRDGLYGTEDDICNFDWKYRK